MRKVFNTGTKNTVRIGTKAVNKIAYVRNQVNQPVNLLPTVVATNDQTDQDNLPRNHAINHGRYEANNSDQTWCTGYGNYVSTNVYVRHAAIPVTNGTGYSEFQVDINE